MVDRHKTGARAKRKGTSLEQKTATALSKWYNETAKKPLKKAFYRVPASGALQWSINMNVDGDVIADPVIKFNYCIECKNVEGWSMENIMRGNKYFPKWLAQSVREGANIKKVPLLVFSKNYANDMVMAPYNSKLTELIDPYIIKTIEYVSEVSGKKEKAKTITFYLDSFTSIPYDKANHLYDDVDWSKQIAKPKVAKKKEKQPNKVADEILMGLKFYE